MIRRFMRSVCSVAFLKFSVIGLLNFFIDLGVLNFLSVITGIYAGTGIVWLNIVSFSVAVTNSYFWNKRWTFNHEGRIGMGEFGKFLLVNAVGTVINSGIVYLLTTVIGPVGGVTPHGWLNISKVLALPPSTLWNFFGARFIFRKMSYRETKSNTVVY